MTDRVLLDPTKAAEHLCKLLGLASSTYDGEALAAVRMADKFLRSRGLRWPDVIALPPTSWHELAAACAKYPDLLSTHELTFVSNMARQQRLPSDRQARWLESIYLRVVRRAA
jgi:hypothetical protein